MQSGHHSDSAADRPDSDRLWQQQQQQSHLVDYGTVGDHGAPGEETDGAQHWLHHAARGDIGEMRPLTEAEKCGPTEASVSMATVSHQATSATATTRTANSTGKPCTTNKKKLDRFSAWVLRVGPSCLSNSDVQKHKKIILISSFFCVFGVVLCSIGTALTAKQPSALYNLVFVIGGFVIFVPGIYYLVYIIRAYHGHDGYLFENLPPMD